MTSETQTIPSEGRFIERASRWLSSPESRSEAPSRAAGHGRFAFLDGVRGWAALIVVFDHETGAMGLDLSKFAAYRYFTFFTHGHLAVLIFFVLSGYVLTASQILNTERKLAVSAVARYFRLFFPILVATLIAYLFLKAGLFFNRQAEGGQATWFGNFFAFEPSLKNALRFSCFDVFFAYNYDASYNSSLWTMPIELMGSYLIYSFIGIFRSGEKVFWNVAIVVALLFMKWNPYLCCFMTGYLMAELKLKRPALPGRFANVALLLAFASVAAVDTLHRPASKQGQAMEAIAMVLIISYSSILERFFSNRFSRWLGKISFSVYLMQVIVMCSWSACLRVWLPHFGLNEIQVAVVNAISTLLLCLAAGSLMSPVDLKSTKLAKSIARWITGERARGH